MKSFLCTIMLVFTLLSAGLVAADPPPISGVVTRDGEPLAFGWIDVRTGLFLFLGIDVQELCLGTAERSEVQYMHVEPPLGLEWVIERFTEDLPAQVWGFTDFDCELFLASEPLATGFAQITAGDNDLWGAGQNNGRSFGGAAHGFLETPDGDWVVLSAYIKWTIVKKQEYARVSAGVLLH